MTKSRADNSEGFTERGINTFNDLPKHKTVLTDRILHRDASTFASIWELHDTYASVPGTASHNRLHSSMHPVCPSVRLSHTRFLGDRYK